MEVSDTILGTNLITVNFIRAIITFRYTIAKLRWMDAVFVTALELARHALKLWTVFMFI